MVPNDDQFTIRVSPSTTAILHGKLHYWLRRSLPRYAFASLLIAVCRPIAFPNLVGNAFEMLFVQILVFVLSLSLLALVIAGLFQGRLFRQQQFEVGFGEAALTVRNARGKEWRFPWARLGRVTETGRHIIIPEARIMREVMDSRVIGLRSAFVFEKSTLAQTGKLQALRHRFRDKKLM